jgi:ribonuclease P/MRP protein subunit RPP1
VKSYDVVAVRPMTEKMFQLACATLEIDVITFDFSASTRLPFPIKHGFVSQALQRGIYFEIVYGPSIVDVRCRRQAIMTAQTIARITRGRNLIVTSGADSEWILRAPADAMSLSGAFGVPAHVRKQALCEHPRRVLEHAASRKLTYRTAIAVLPEGAEKERGLQSSDMLDDFISLN